MSIKYFTGNNVAGKKAGSGLTAMTLFWVPETPPVAGVDGMDPKDRAALSKYESIIAKVHSTSALSMKGGKARTNHPIGKYNLGRMWKYRKTLKKLMTATGNTAHSGTVGERRFKGNGNTGNTAMPKNVQQTPLADSYELYPIDAGK